MTRDRTAQIREPNQARFHLFLNLKRAQGLRPASISHPGARPPATSSWAGCHMESIWDEWSRRCMAVSWFPCRGAGPTPMVRRRAAADAPPQTDPEPETQPEIESSFWLRRGDQVFLAVLIAAALALMLWHWARLSGWGVEPVEIERLESRRYDYRVDVNTATWVEWIQLESIGETLAERIIEDREQNGPFESIDDLQRVRGIGPKTVEKLRPWLTVGPPDNAVNAH
jgi:competence protein ComEA